MSLWMPIPKFDPTRFNPNQIRGFDKNLKAGTAKVMRWPRPVVGEVQVDLWGAEGGELVAQQITAQLDLAFQAESVYLPIDWTLAKWYRPPFNTLEHAKVLGKSRIRLVTEGWTDNSELERGDGPKEVRLTWNGRMEAYIPYRPAEARLVRTIEGQLYDSSTDPATLLVESIGGADD